MRGTDTFTESLFTMRHLDDFVPADHPLHVIRMMVNKALTTRVRHFDSFCRPRWDAGVIQIKYLHALMRLFPSFCVVPIYV